MCDNKNPKLMGIQYLEVIQVLYQNQEIDALAKKKLVTSIKNGIETGNFQEVNQLLKIYTIGTDFGYLIENLIKQ